MVRKSKIRECTVQGLAPRLVCIMPFALLLPQPPAAQGKTPETQSSQAKGYSVPIIDLSGETHHQIIVDKKAGQEHPHEKIVFTRFTLDWLTGGKEKFDS